MSVVPDSIEPVVAWRGWRLKGDELASCHYGGTWKPGVEHAAECLANEKPKAWQAVSIEEAVESGAPLASEWTKPKHDPDDEDYGATYGVPRPPRTLLPFDMAYVYREDAHDSPGESCKCGIYAVADPAPCASYPISVLGRVALWGKVVPGDKGWRAEYAYPLELFVLDAKPTNPHSMWSMLMFTTAEEKFPPRKGIEDVLSERYGVPTQRIASMDEAQRLVAA